MNQQVDHYELNELLRACGSSWNASQAHGLLCSRLSIAGPDGAIRWFAQILEEAAPGHDKRDECEAHLDTLYATTWRELVERQSELGLLLPHDDDPIATRTAALGLWCEGYLHGLVAEKHSEALKERLAAEPLADVIKDMLQITRVVEGDDDDQEEDETALFELVEYVRVAAQLVYEELADFRDPAEDELSDESATVH